MFDKTQVRLEITGASRDEVLRFTEIFQALLASGGLSGVKGGKTIIHFDDIGNFRGVQLDYWPFRKRSVDR